VLGFLHKVHIEWRPRRRPPRPLPESCTLRARVTLKKSSVLPPTDCLQQPRPLGRAMAQGEKHAISFVYQEDADPTRGYTIPPMSLPQCNRCPRWSLNAGKTCFQQGRKGPEEKWCVEGQITGDRHWSKTKDEKGKPRKVTRRRVRGGVGEGPKSLPNAKGRKKSWVTRENWERA